MTARAVDRDEERVDKAVLSVRLDVLVWLAVVGAAAALRFARLDALPLTFDESARAFDILRTSNSDAPDGWTGDLAGAATSYLFRIFGESDLLVRVIPAAGGVAMAAIVWLGGRGLGRNAALVAGALLAFSPLAVLLSRDGEPFALGGLLAVAMVLSLLSYVRSPRALTAFLFAVALGLAPSVDAVSTTAALAVVLFVFVEVALDRGGAVARAWGVFRRSPGHWLSVALVLAASLELGVTSFGTSLDNGGLAGLRAWGDMFALPRDSREVEYHLALLLAYDWPMVLAGGAAAAVFAWRAATRGAGALTDAQRLILVWLAVGALVLTLVSRREAGQLLIVLPPLAIAAGLLVEDMLPRLDWGVLRRWWPVAAALVGLLAYGAYVVNDWSHVGGLRRETALAGLAALAFLALAVATWWTLRERALPLALLVFSMATAAFALHSDMVIVADGEGEAELAVDMRTAERIGRFESFVGEIVASRSGPIVVDEVLSEPLRWYLRDLPVVFGEPAGEESAVVVPAGREIEGYTRVGDTWRLGWRWYPDDLRFVPMWRWFREREPYDNFDSFMTVDAQILVPAP